MSKVLKGMATYPSILAWRIPWTEESGGLQSTGSQSRTRLKRLSIHTKCCKGGDCGLRSFPDLGGFHFPLFHEVCPHTGQRVGQGKNNPLILVPDTLILNPDDEMKPLSLSQSDNSQASGAGTPGRGAWAQALRVVLVAAGVYQPGCFSLLLPGRD